MEGDEQEPRAAADRSAKLRAFFARFVAPSDLGVLLVAHDEDGRPLGFSTV